MNRYFRLLSLWLPVAVWACIIFFFSSLPTLTTTRFYLPDFVIKKAAHVGEYAIFAILLYRALWATGLRRRNAGLLAVLIAVIYASTDEFHQSFTPGRQPTIRDIFFDTIGSILGILALWNLLPRAPMKLKTWAINLQLI